MKAYMNEQAGITFCCAGDKGASGVSGGTNTFSNSSPLPFTILQKAYISYLHERATVMPCLTSVPASAELIAWRLQLQLILQSLKTGSTVC